MTPRDRFTDVSMCTLPSVGFLHGRRFPQPKTRLLRHGWFVLGGHSLNGLLSWVLSFGALARIGAALGRRAADRRRPAAALRSVEVAG